MPAWCENLPKPWLVAVRPSLRTPCVARRWPLRAERASRPTEISMRVLERGTDSTASLRRTGPAPQLNGAEKHDAPIVLYKANLPVGDVVSASASQLSDILSERQLGVLAEGPIGNGVSSAKFDWAQEEYNEGVRGAQIWAFVITLRVGLASLDQKWSYLGGYTDEKKSSRARSLAVYTRESVLKLGPTFIKLGQLLSTRADLLAPEFVSELSTLQDQVPAFAPEKAMEIIETQLGAPVTRLFKRFEKWPIAAASLGQVHRATMFSGREVVLKVQRPGLARLFDIDLKSLRQVAQALDSFDERRDLTSIYEECAQVLYQEIDYIQEGKNASRFKRNFKAVEWVRVPEVEWSLSSPQVLTLEYLPGVGVKITDAAGMQALGIDSALVARRSTEAYLTQILKHAFYHCDPHPGNIALDARGSLIFYDFGMMGTIVPGVREKLLEVFYGTFEKDSDRVLDALIALEVIKPARGDKLSLRRFVAYSIENIARKTERGATIGAIGEDLFAIAVDQPLRFPATFTFVLRAFSTLEGICKSLDPQYNFSRVATPYAQELLDLNNASARNTLILEQVQQQAAELTQAAAQAPLRIQYLERTLKQMEEGELKLRVRVLESERAARRQGVLQAATLNCISLFGFLNLGANFALAGHEQPAVVCMLLSTVFAGLLGKGFLRVKSLDKFERDIRNN